MDLAFFGLTSDNIALYRNNLFTQIHEIVFHGKGGYDWHTVYNMPLWLRRFTFNKISEFYKKENEGTETKSKGLDNIPDAVKKAASQNRKRDVPAYLDKSKKPSIKIS